MNSKMLLIYLILIFDGRYVPIILLNSTIQRTFLIDLSNCLPSSISDKNFTNLKIEQRLLLPICAHAAIFSLLPPFEETKWRSKRVITPWIDIENEKFQGYSLRSKLFLNKNKTFCYKKLFSMSKDGRDSATLILMKFSHFDRTALYSRWMKPRLYCWDRNIKCPS